MKQYSEFFHWITIINLNVYKYFHLCLIQFFITLTFDWMPYSYANLWYFSPSVAGAGWAVASYSGGFSEKLKKKILTFEFSKHFWTSQPAHGSFWPEKSHLPELRKYKNGLASVKNLFVLKLPPFFPYRVV